MSIRDELVDVVLRWENAFGHFPGQGGITAAISEYDAAIILGYSETEYIDSIRGMSPVSSGHDFIFRENRIQVKANRPSGKPGSTVWNAGKKVESDKWDMLVYILYDQRYKILEVWGFESRVYEDLFKGKNNLRLDDMRKGKNLL